MKEYNDIDLATLQDRFVETVGYSKEDVLNDLQYYQMFPDFLCIVHDSGFLIGHRHRDSLWIAQVYYHGDKKISESTWAYAVNWARERGMTSLSCDTNRNQVKALAKYGLKEESVIMRMDI